MLIEAIKAHLESLPPDRDPTSLGMSALGHCVKQNAYRYNGVPGAALGWKALSIFDDGHITHRHLRKWIALGLKKRKDCYRLVKREGVVELSPWVGHVDGYLKHRRGCKNPKQHDMLLEVKSMNPWAFKRTVESGTLEMEYASKLSGYRRGAGFDTALVLIKDKGNGNLYEFIYTINNALLDERLEKHVPVFDGVPPEHISREYSPDKQGKLPWQCGYCPWVEPCWKDYGLSGGDHKWRIDMTKWHETKLAVEPKAILEAPVGPTAAVPLA